MSITLKNISKKTGIISAKTIADGHPTEMEIEDTLKHLTDDQPINN